MAIHLRAQDKISQRIRQIPHTHHHQENKRKIYIITQKGKEGIVSFAEGDEQRMMLMGLRRYTKYTNMPNVIGLREIITSKLVAENAYCF